MGRPRALIAVLAACLLLAGCGSGPSQVRAAVLIGDREITVDQVQQLIDKAVREQPAAQQLAQQHKLDEVGREIVRQFVTHELIARAARREGLAVDQALLAQTMAQDPLASPVSTTDVDPSQLPQQIVYRARDHREAIEDVLLQQALGSKYFDKTAITVDYTAVTSDDGGDQPVTMREKAFAKAEQMAADPDAATRMLKAESDAGGPVSVGQRIVAAQSPTDAATAAFGAPAGTVVAFQPSTEETRWIVLIVRERDLNSTTSVDQTTAPTGSQLVTFGQRLLQPYVEQAGMKINPRYGVWDPVAMDLAPSTAETTGLVLPVKGFVQP